MIISEKHIPSCKFEYTIRYWTGGFYLNLVLKFKRNF